MNTISMLIYLFYGLLFLSRVPVASGQWSVWYNIDTPAGDGDFETFQRIQQGGNTVCSTGSTISRAECRVVNSSVVFVSSNVSSAPDTLTTACTADGLLCENNRQNDGSCSNYEVRFFCQDGTSSQVVMIPGDFTLLYIAIVLTILGIIASLVLIGIVGWRIHSITKGTQDSDVDLHLIQRVREKRMSADLHARRTSKIRVYTYENHILDRGNMKLTIPAYDPKPKPRYDDDGGVYDGTNSPVHHREEVYYNSFIYDRGIEISAFGQYLKQKGQRDGFDKEFKELQKGSVHPREMASKPENKSKNRYLTNMPYDHSIVVLEPIAGMPDSGYINANFIDSTEQAHRYIAAQGPMTKTMGDFWLMIWQQQSGVIVMLTRFRENNKLKCAPYCPEARKGHTLTFGVFNVTLEDHRIYNSYEHRTLSLQNKNCGSKRTIEHFQYTAWFDHWTPSHLQLVKFHRKITEVKTSLKGPMVVHCSAGIGRTGTFITLDGLLEQAKQTNQVQTFNFIKLMRKDRMNMIQTLEQYTFAHHVLYEALRFHKTEVSRKKFLEVYKEMTEDIEKSPKLANEFRILMEMKEVWWEEHEKDKHHKTTKGFHFKIGANESETYIPAYGKSGPFVLTKYSHTKTIEEILDIIVSRNTTTVLALPRSSSDFLSKFLPGVDGEASIERYRIRTLSQTENSTANVTTTTVEIRQEDNGKPSPFTLITLGGSRDSITPSEMAALVGMVSVKRGKDSKDSVLLISGNGHQEGAKFAVVAHVIEEAAKEKTVDVFNTVRQIQIWNPKLISNLDQYAYCHRAVVEFLLTDTDYVNT